MNCSLSTCDRERHATGYCRGHYMQMYFHGKITSDVIRDNYRTGLIHKKKKKDKCIIVQCKRESAGQAGHCGAHYGQTYRHGRITHNIILSRGRAK